MGVYWGATKRMCYINDGNDPMLTVLGMDPQFYLCSKTCIVDSEPTSSQLGEDVLPLN